MWMMSTVFLLDKPAPSLTMVWPMLSLRGWRSSRRCWSTAHSNITRYTHAHIHLHSLLLSSLTFEQLLLLLLLLLFYIIINIFLHFLISNAFLNEFQIECLLPFCQTTFLIQEANKFTFFTYHFNLYRKNIFSNLQGSFLKCKCKLSSRYTHTQRTYIQMKKKYNIYSYLYTYTRLQNFSHSPVLCALCYIVPDFQTFTSREVQDIVLVVQFCLTLAAGNLWVLEAFGLSWRDFPTVVGRLVLVQAATTRRVWLVWTSIVNLNLYWLCFSSLK